MANQKWVLLVGILALGGFAGILGGLNVMWAKHGNFPAYGWLIDLIAMAVFAASLIYIRRMKKLHVDEFAITKKRYATQIGFMAGFLLFALTGLFPIMFKSEYHAFLTSMDGPDDAFIIGRVFGMAPFVVGLLVGQIASWAKYR